MTSSREIQDLNAQICETFGVDHDHVVEFNLHLSTQRLPSLIVTRQHYLDGEMMRATDRYLITRQETP